jgi:ribosomal protein L15
MWGSTFPSNIKSGLSARGAGPPVESCLGVQRGRQPSGGTGDEGFDKGDEAVRVFEKGRMPSIKELNPPALE